MEMPKASTVLPDPSSADAERFKFNAGRPLASKQKDSSPASALRKKHFFILDIPPL